MIDGEATRHLSLKSMKALIAGDGLDLGPRNPVLVVVHGSDIGRVYELDEERVVVGRSATCPIHLNEVGVSRSHALLYRGDDGGLYVSDLGSTNGTFVNGERIERCRLDEGDKVQFGTSTVLRVAFQDRLDEAFHKNQYDAATRDGLTGVLN